MTQQFKVLLAFVALFLVSASAVGLCAPGYVQAEDCVEKAVDPEGGNCWWAADFMSCEIYADTAELCSEYCTKCLLCMYHNDCCAQGDPNLYLGCTAMCVANLPNM